MTYNEIIPKSKCPRFRSLLPYMVLASYILQALHSIIKEKQKLTNVKNHRLADQWSSIGRRLLSYLLSGDEMQ
jgi:hypothetical protein